MTTRYTKEQTASLISAYKAAKTDAERASVVTRQAELMGKSRQSVISKLSREQVYVKPTQTKKVESTSKEQYIQHIAIMLGVRDVSRLDSLEKASKATLQLMSQHLNKMHDRSEVK